VTGHETKLVLPQWNDFRLRVVLYRKHVHPETRRNFQLDLFTPDDGHYEYSAIATNLPLGLSALWALACGRAEQEKTFAELKGPSSRSTWSRRSTTRPIGPGSN
jgi:hypothetical protein